MPVSVSRQSARHLKRSKTIQKRKRIQKGEAEVSPFWLCAMGLT